MIYFQSQVDRLMKSKDERITSLEREVEVWRSQADQERRRAETAIDRLLNREGAPSVTPGAVRTKAEERIASAIEKVVLVGGDVGEAEPGLRG